MKKVLMKKDLILFILILFLPLLLGWRIKSIRNTGLKGKMVFANHDGKIYLLDLPIGRWKRIKLKAIKIPDDYKAPIKRAFNPALSPDGTRIAYSNNRGLWIVNIDGSQQRLVTKKGAAVQSSNKFFHPIAWSPDGKKIAFYTGGSRGYYPRGTNKRVNIKRGVYIFAIDGEKEKLMQVYDWHGKLGKIILALEDPEWSWEEIRTALIGRTSPDGRKIISTSRGRRVYVANIDGSNRIYLFSSILPIFSSKEEKWYDYWKLQWSPDGKKIFYWVQPPISYPALFSSYALRHPLNSLFFTKYKYYLMMMNPDGTAKEIVKKYSFIR